MKAAYILLGAAILLCTLLLFLLMKPQPAISRKPSRSLPISEYTQGDEGRVDIAEDPHPLEKAPPRGKPRLYLVLDDAGQSLRDVKPFLDLKIPITFALLPWLPDTRVTARAVRESGMGLILHMPMEPLGNQDPGPGALMADDDFLKVKEKLQRALGEVGDVEGVNNHMGSRATQSPVVVGALVETLGERVKGKKPLYLLDSRTTADSLLFEEGLKAGIPSAGRQVFLDNVWEDEAIREAFKKSFRIARNRGEAVAIGHVTCPLLPTLIEEMAHKAQREGLEVRLLRDKWE